MRSKSLKAAMLLMIVPVFAAAGDEPERVRKSEINKRPFAVGELRITITKFWPGSLLTRGYIEVKVENPSSASATFNPQRLSFVTRSNRQINVRSRRQQGAISPGDSGLDLAQPREIAPGAYIKELYELDGRVRLPARLIYEGKQLALITD
ncbi:MAG TPA: hypothetical protein VJZ26_02090 [Blastocatellia bacterium]|nr:hypothetical protein [Blastocatellia bacterium]